MYAERPVSPDRGANASRIAEGFASAYSSAAGAWGLRALARDHVVVALFSLREWSPWLGDAIGLLDAAELARTQRQRQQQHRHGLVLAYALHRLFLADALGLPPTRVPLTRDAHGRPVLAGMAADTSLSHDGQHVAVALSRHGPVGTDIEPASRAGGMPEIAERICHPGESFRLAGLGASEQERALLGLWVRKEAFLKAAGVGLAREMDTFALPDGEPVALHSGGEGQVCIDLLDVGPAAVCAVARPPGLDCRVAWMHPTSRHAG